MWKLRRASSIESDLSDAADDLKQAVDQLLDVSVHLVKDGNEQASRSVVKLILALQDDECMLRKYAERFKLGGMGRRADD